MSEFETASPATEVKTRKPRAMKAETVKDEKVYPTPLVTTSTRKKHPGFVNPNKGIETSPGLTMQDVPRDMIIRHLRESENYWKQRFAQQYSGYSGSQSF